MHAVHQLYFYRKSLATKTFNARGKSVERCELCRVAKNYCVCQRAPLLNTRHAVLLLMHDIEVLKPSNTGKLIADVVPETHAFIWQRNVYSSPVKALIEDPEYQPILVFPKEYALENQRVAESLLPEFSDKQLLIILIDGSWREAKKIYRKSAYLHNIPILSVDPKLLMSGDYQSKYQIRKASKLNQLATAEVAAQVFGLAGDRTAASVLSAWFEAYSYQYQRSVCQKNQGDPEAWQRYYDLMATLKLDYRSDLSSDMSKG